MEQRLITVYLTEEVDEDRGIQELLNEWLEDGWRVASLTPLGTGGGGTDNILSCWFAVVLERGGA
jgi:hypothetical protein